MRSKNSFAVNFFLRLARQSNGHAPLMVRVTVNKQRKEISLKYNIPVDKWNATKQTLSGTSPEITSLNKYIAEIRTELHNAYRQLQLQKKLATVDAIKAIFLGQGEGERTVMQVVQYHNDTMKDVLAWGTAKNYYTTQKYVGEFLQVKLKTSDIYLRELNYKFLADFDLFLRNHVPGENQKPCSNNTVMKHIERFRKIINMAIKNEWLAHDPFMKFKPTFIKKDRGYLTQDELDAIENKEIHNASLRAVRDMFVFSCYTGLSFIDTFKLRWDNINKGIDGNLWITVHRQKTGVKSQIPILPAAMKVLENFKVHPKTLITGNPVPMLSNQRFNSYLKELADICSIDKNVTHHLARHTFATTVCLANGVSLEALAGMMGHASIRTTQIYARILPKRISNEMQNLRERLESRKTNSLGFVREAQ